MNVVTEAAKEKFPEETSFDVVCAEKDKKEESEENDNSEEKDKEEQLQETLRKMKTEKAEVEKEMKTLKVKNMEKLQTLDNSLNEGMEEFAPEVQENYEQRLRNIGVDPMSPRKLEEYLVNLTMENYSRRVKLNRKVAEIFRRAVDEQEQYEARKAEFERMQGDKKRKASRSSVSSRGSESDDVFKKPMPRSRKVIQKNPKKKQKEEEKVEEYDPEVESRKLEEKRMAEKQGSLTEGKEVLTKENAGTDKPI